MPANFADWHWAAQLNQARAVTYAIDRYRRWWPLTSGAIIWQLNDCWPVTSWAAIDSEDRPKPLWYAMRHAFAPRNLVFVSELVKDWEPMVVRLAILDHSYRQDWSWHDGLLDQAADRLEGWRAAGVGEGSVDEVRAALDDKDAAFRTEGGDRNVDGIAMAVIEITPDDRMLTWDNTRLH